MCMYVCVCTGECVGIFVYKDHDLTPKLTQVLMSEDIGEQLGYPLSIVLSSSGYYSPPVVSNIFDKSYSLQSRISQGTNYEFVFN